MALFDRRKKNIETAVADEETPASTIVKEETEPSEFIEPKAKIGENEVRAAMQTLRAYQGQKAHLDDRIVQNEQWWKLKTWDKYEHGDKKDKVTGSGNSSAWLWNVIVAKHADCMDAYPEPNILPRMPDDIGEAHRLKNIIPIILEQNNFQSVYNDIMWYKIRQGTGVYGIFWDSNKNNGLGDIAIRKIDILNLFWEGGVDDIQESQNVFYLTLQDNKELQQLYPQLQGKLGNRTVKPRQYQTDDSIDQSEKSTVVDWYYHTFADNGVKVLQYCKFVGSEVLFATENEVDENGNPKYPNGLYEHGKYPFVMDAMYPIETTPCGYGLIDICKGAQEQIDILDQAVIKNAVVTARPRFLVRSDAGMNEREFADTTNDLIHFTGNIDDTSFRQLNCQPISSIYVNILDQKISEMKETSGNRDVNNGGITNGATAASAIAALQEASGKLSRDNNKASYDAYTKVIQMCIELVRQFYDMPRWFRILGADGEQDFVQYSNAGLVAQPQGEAFGMDMGYRLPVFDIEVNAQKQTSYTKMAQNELAMQLNSAGFFQAENAQGALTCLNMMDFAHKDDVIRDIKQNALFLQQMQQLTQMVAQMAQTYGDQQALMVLQQIMGQGQGKLQPSVGQEPPDMNPEGKESSYTENARRQTQESTQVQ